MKFCALREMRRQKRSCWEKQFVMWCGGAGVSHGVGSSTSVYWSVLLCLPDYGCVGCYLCGGTAFLPVEPLACFRPLQCGAAMIRLSHTHHCPARPAAQPQISPSLFPPLSLSLLNFHSFLVDPAQSSLLFHLLSLPSLIFSLSMHHVQSEAHALQLIVWRLERQIHFWMMNCLRAASKMAAAIIVILIHCTLPPANCHSNGITRPPLS